MLEQISPPETRYSHFSAPFIALAVYAVFIAFIANIFRVVGILIIVVSFMQAQAEKITRKSYNIDSADEIAGKYNVFKDCQITTSELLPYTK
ncbi:MAG: hypothetical protein GX756_06875, partial [Clostridiales bacterium]|nr:hypothetical protein [Clostridiales bacterium]